MAMTFEEWKHAVDLAIQRKCGLSADDMPEWDYWSAYDDGVSPSKAAAMAIRAAMD